jgi:sugar (pentulose or hexulose) kinase
MHNRLVAGVDCSTQSTKVIVVDVDNGEIKASGQVEHEVFRSGPASETDPDKAHRPLRRAILWDDTRSANMAEQLIEALDGLTLQNSSLILMS